MPAACGHCNKKTMPPATRELCPLSISRLCYCCQRQWRQHHTTQKRERDPLSTPCGVIIVVQFVCQQQQNACCWFVGVHVHGCVSGAHAAMVLGRPAGSTQAPTVSAAGPIVKPEQHIPGSKRAQSQKDRSPAQQTDCKPFVTACTSLHDTTKVPADAWGQAQSVSRNQNDERAGRWHSKRL